MKKTNKLTKQFKYPNLSMLALLLVIVSLPTSLALMYRKTQISPKAAGQIYQDPYPISAPVPPEPAPLQVGPFYKTSSTPITSVMNEARYGYYAYAGREPTELFVRAYAEEDPTVIQKRLALYEGCAYTGGENHYFESLPVKLEQYDESTLRIVADDRSILPPGKHFILIYDDYQGGENWELNLSTISPSGILSDLNNDFFVDILDFTIMSNEFLLNLDNSIDSQLDYMTVSDLNCDGYVDILDFTIMSNEFFY